MRFSTSALSVFWILCLLGLALSVQAQVTTGRLEGCVTDSSGAVVPNARVEAVNAETNARAETTTNTHGLYAILALLPGEYTVTVEVSGFRKAVRTNVLLTVGSTTAENIRLEVGPVTESITVQATVEKVQTTESHTGRVISLRDIKLLPQLGRTPITLAVFQPGVQSSNPGEVISARVNGLRQGSNNSKLDGIDVNDAVVPRLGLSLTMNNTDSVAEFRVVTAGAKAEYGRNAGAQIELITRSGTNTYHGNAFNYLRNTVLHANPFFNNSSGVVRPKFIQNIFGGSFGGPIRREKTFLFGNYQGRRVRQEIVRTRTVLTPEIKSGIFRWRAPGSPAISQYNIFANDPRGKGLDPKMADILKLLPDPNNADVGDGLNTAGYRFNNPNNLQDDQFTIRGDHYLWRTHRIFYRHSWARISGTDSINNGDATFPGQVEGTQGGPRWGMAFGSDWTITPAVVNEFRYGRQSASADFLRPARLPGPMLLANTFTNPLDPSFAAGRRSPVDDWSDNLTIVRGKHTFKTGTNIRWTTQYGYDNNGVYPNVTFGVSLGNVVPTTVGPTGSVIGSADRQRFENHYNELLGRMNQVTQTFYSNLQEFQKAGASRIRNHKFREYGFFFQDDWKIRPNLTFNLGLRWEFFGVPFEADGLQGVIDKVAQIGCCSQISNLTVQRSGNWYESDKNNFAPRFGFSWDPKGDGKTAVRGAYGIFYDRLIGATTNLVDETTPGFSQAVPVFPNQAAGSDVRVSDAIPLPSRPPAPVLTLPNTRSTPIVVFDPNLATGYVHHFSLNVQREVVRNTIVDLGYVGTYGVKLFMDVDWNQQRIYGDFLTSFQQLQAFRANGTPVPATNTLVRIFGSAAAATSTIGASTIDQGQVSAAAATVDRNNYPRYAAAGVSDFYLRNYPQYNQVVYGANSGRSYYNSLQVSVRRQTRALKLNLNYTFSKSTDNVSADGSGFAAPIDNHNLKLNKARGDGDIPHTLGYAAHYTLPLGRGQRWGGHWPRLGDFLLGGWDLGFTGLWQSGSVFTVSSGRQSGPYTISNWANYTGDRNIGSVTRRGDGVYFWTSSEIAAFSFPAAGQIGTSGRNAFRRPRFFNVDVSLTKRFKINEQHAVSFRAEAYNLLNNTNFGGFGATLTTPASFGKFNNTLGSPRIMQLVLRYDF